MKLFERILLATDFSTCSEAALAEAVRIAPAESGASLIVFHAYQLPGSFAYAPAAAYEQVEQVIREEADKKLAEVTARLSGRGVDVRGILCGGLPDEKIVETANREGVDLIVMGTHGRRGPARIFMGSVAANVVATASCPVLTVRAAKPGEESQAVQAA